jgi:toxin CptA
MTIAVSVVVHPSRVLLLSVCAMATMATIAAILILFGAYELSLGLRLQISAFATIFSGVAVFKAHRARKTFHIDISGIGQIRLTQYSGVSAFDMNSRQALDGDSGQLVHLSPESILWSQFLLLRLKPEQGATLSVPVLLDSVSGSDFASLSVACRYVAIRNSTPKIID